VVQISRQHLVSLLAKGGSSVSEIQVFPNDQTDPISNDRKRENDGIRLEAEAQVKRCGMEMKLVVAPKHTDHAISQTVPSLLKAVARGHQWAEWIRSGEVADLRSVARRVGLTKRYVTRVMGCAYLAPDIVEAILEGRQPADLSFEKLTRPLPMKWNSQKRILGLRNS
jgi:hypothetical protein